MIRQSTVLVPECADFRVPICDFSPENDPPINSFSSWVCGFTGSFRVKRGPKSYISRKVPKGSGVFHRDIPLEEIPNWAWQTDDRHRTNTKFKVLLHNSPFGAIMALTFCFSKLWAQIFRKVLSVSNSFISVVFCDWEHHRGYDSGYIKYLILVQTQSWGDPAGHGAFK